MDYEQFYRYLDSTPKAEIRECVQNILRLAKKHSIPVETESRQADSASDTSLSQVHRLQVAQQVWFQHAVWNKFGANKEEHASLKDLAEATASLCVSTEVGEFIVNVNRSIDEKIDGSGSKCKNMRVDKPKKVEEIACSYR